MKSRFIPVIAALAILAGALTSPPARAADDDPPGPKVLRPQAAGDARVRIVHASNDTGPVDIWIGDTRALAGVPFGAVSDYLDVTPGTPRIRVFEAGALPSTPALIDQTPALAGGTSYTIAACRPRATIATPCVTEDSLAPPVSGAARVRLFHYAPAPIPSPVDLISGTTTLVNDLAYLADPDDAEIPGGTYDLKLTNSGGTTTTATLTDTQILPGKVYDLFAIGAGASFRVVSSVTTPSARIRVAHALAGGPAVDILVDGTKVASGVPFFAASGYLDVTAGSHQISITRAGETTPILGPTPVSVEAGRAYTVVAHGATGIVSSLGIKAFLDDTTAPGAGSARVRLIHLSPDAPPVSLRVNGIVLPGVPALSFRDASPYVELPAGAPSIQAIVASGPSAGAVAAALPLLTLEAGRIYDVFVIDQVARVRAEVRVTDTAARVRMAHASGVAGPADVYVDATKVLSGTVLGSVSDYLSVAPGLRRVRIVPAGGNPDTAAAIDVTPTFEGGRAYTVAARDQGATPAAAVVEDSQGTSVAGKAKVRVYHLSSKTAAVDVRVAGGSTLINDLAPGQAGAVLEIDPGTYTLEITSADGAQVLATLANVRLDGRANYDLLALDAPDLKVVSVQSLPLDVPAYRAILPTIFT